MSTNDNGGPAFPTSNGGSPDDGMTLRDYFAAKCLPAIVTITGASMHTPRDGMSTDDSMAADAYALADAMLKARQA